jgi:hypothetical protein
MLHMSVSVRAVPGRAWLAMTAATCLASAAIGAEAIDSAMPDSTK